MPNYLNEIQQSDYVIIIIDSRSVSAVYFEAGYTLGRELRAIYFVGPKGKIPRLMEQSAFSYPMLVRFHKFQKLEDIPELLKQIMPALQDEESNDELDSHK